MPRIVSDALITHAHELVSAGSTVKDAAAEIGISADVLSKKLRARGVAIRRNGWAPPNRKELPEDLIIQRYLAGESILALAKSFDVARGVIVDRLKTKGCDIRGGSEANLLRMGRLSSDAKRSLVSKARAVRATNLVNAAAANGESRAIGIGENEIAAALVALGYDVVRQQIVDDYLIDIAIGDIAVEIKSKAAFTLSGIGGLKRTKHLFERGKRLVVVTIDDKVCIIERLNEIVALVDFTCRHPAPLGEYWMVRCCRRRAKLGYYLYDLTIERRTPDLTEAIP